MGKFFYKHFCEDCSLSPRYFPIFRIDSELDGRNEKAVKKPWKKHLDELFIKRAEILLQVMVSICQELHISIKDIERDYTEAEIYDLWHAICATKGIETRTKGKIIEDAGFTEEDMKKIGGINGRYN